MNCIVCGKKFKQKCKHQLTCSFACRTKHRQETARLYKLNHPDKVKQYQKTADVKRKEERRKPVNYVKLMQQDLEKDKPEEPVKQFSTLDVKTDDPEWVKRYATSDRLTRLTMLSRELNNVCRDKPIFTYGKLSMIYGTDKYQILEADMIKRKRLSNE